MSNPVVVTHAASNITDNSATFNGEVTDMGSLSEVNALFYYQEEGMGTGWWQTPAQVLTEPSHYSIDTSGFHTLEQNTTYNFYAILVFDGSLVAQGDILSFTTLEGFTHPDSPETLPASDVEETQVTLNGEVTNMGDANEVQALFWYQKDGMGSSWWATSPSQTVTYPVTYSHTLTGLDPDTVYNFFARIEYYDNDGGGWAKTGSIMSFTTTTPYQYTYGSGTEEDPYQVWTPDDLNGVREHLHAHFIQKADIDLSGYEYDPWEPISTFTGSYNGDDFDIINMNVDVALTGDKELAGLFGLTNGADLKRINIIDPSCYGAKYIGGMVGRAVSTTIQHCCTTKAPGSAKTIFGQEYVGGLIGRAETCNSYDSYSTCDVVGKHVDNAYFTTMFFNDAYGNIYEVSCEAVHCGGFAGHIGADLANTERCYALGNVLCGDPEMEKEDYYGAYAGGFAGTIFAGQTVDACYAKGDVTASFGVGGFVGITDSSTIKNSFGRGRIEPIGEEDVQIDDGEGNTMRLERALAGFCGRFQHADGHVEHSYATGFVYTMSSTGSQSGGFVYKCHDDATYEYNYWDEETSQQNNSEMAYGRLTAHMVYPYEEAHVDGTYVNWQFYSEGGDNTVHGDFIENDYDGPWYHDINHEKNDGYPMFEKSILRLVSKCIPFLFKVPYLE